MANFTEIPLFGETGQHHREQDADRFTLR
jgi:hypothetical protein